ncbi:hypothetical protein HMPREF1049_2059 [Fusobacterium necrophorum subsp. funduliforme ATCC 51357]|uniref:Uncharacterized protein n=2 Tax=Fusobacterium necrophorum subsp. funduliforme TaxID=143387 RepID=A0A162IR03_9FUSO|nr:hypothetical protein [Fusobacterium necrophorum]AYV94005.1 hypothetical protein BSQ88_10165 [Fusobacterium necrophorum subsp. funduliforme]EIJ70240.1 hypothetical protein HMPREF1049_2059 [Fusobacterium necrophorum subsp. funduliforme ATCC 51357]EYD68443.1 hypothetical protein FNF_09772 [Fusobacterium necrophorum subsp. funduliforme B35]KAB0551791.1 hypothetical protein F7P76_10265 [Fusobacterium necrophorum subsp. funduliforme]KYL04001.1 hypothetical protein A2J07_10860 [Fusobacterium necro
MFPVMLFIFLFMGMILIEFEEIKSLFFVQQLEQEKNNAESEQELLHNIVSYEVEELKKYLHKNPKKSIYHYLVETEDNSDLLSKQKGNLSIGGYQLENELPKNIMYDTWKGYFVKYYEIVEQKQTYKIRFMIEYRYGKNKKVTEFLSYQIIEMEVYLL